jgi:hypothetical protein
MSNLSNVFYFVCLSVCSPNNLEFITALVNNVRISGLEFPRTEVSKLSPPPPGRVRCWSSGGRERVVRMMDMFIFNEIWAQGKITF